MVNEERREGDGDRIMGTHRIQRSEDQRREPKISNHKVRPFTVTVKNSVGTVGLHARHKGWALIISAIATPSLRNNRILFSGSSLS